jgi:hypothetical protein
VRTVRASPPSTILKGGFIVHFAIAPRAPLAIMCMALACGTVETHATYIGLGTTLHTTVTVNGVSRSVFRVYAVFDDPDDYLTSCGGSPLEIHSRNSTDTGPGSNFLNTAGNFAPTFQQINANPDAQWDTFATIGVVVNDGSDQTWGGPPFPSFIDGNSLITSTAWFTPGPQEQGRAGGPNGVKGTFYWSFIDSFIQGMGVLVMQLTVNAGDHVRGTVNLGFELNGVASQAIVDDEFGSFVPVPPAAAAINMFGFLLAHRRRRQ